MTKKRIRVPVGLVIAMVILLVAGLALQPVFRNLPEQVRVKNVILNGIPFIMIFVAIILGLITFIWMLASVLNDNVSPRIHKPVESILIAGIVLGILGMFQPWTHVLYRIGFHLLLVSTVGFIVWSHIRPKGTHRPAELTGVAIGEKDEV